MKNSTSLQRLKNVLHNNEGKDEGVYNLCAVMELVGGYSELMNLSLSAVHEILDYLEFVNKEQTKNMPKTRRGRR